MATGAFVWLVSLSVLGFFGSIFVVWLLIVRMPTDYLTRGQRPMPSFFRRHPLLLIIGLIAKNAMGLGLMLMGVLMLFTPGQGILLIFIGLTLVDFPHRRERIQRMIRRRGVLGMINKLRRRAGKAPLEVPN